MRETTSLASIVFILLKKKAGSVEAGKQPLPCVVVVRPKACKSRMSLTLGSGFSVTCSTPDLFMQLT